MSAEAETPSIVPCVLTGAACRAPQRMRDGCGCICDLRKLSGQYSDWTIARLTGVATYAQLLDVGPGLFEAFPDMRSDGNAGSSLSAFNGVGSFRGRQGPAGWISREAEAPPPPNLVSTVLVDGGMSVADLKRALVRATLGRSYDPVIKPLFHSSRSYRYPELTLGEIVAAFVFYALVFSVFIGALIVEWRRSEARAAYRAG